MHVFKVMTLKFSLTINIFLYIYCLMESQGFQWPRLHVPSEVSLVSSLVGELRYLMPQLRHHSDK